MDDLFLIVTAAREGDGFRTPSATARAIGDRIETALGYDRVVVKLLDDVARDQRWAPILAAGESGRPTVITDIAGRPGAAAAATTAGFDAHGAVFVPMIARGRLVGILAGFDRELRYRDAVDIELFTTAALAASVAIDTATTAAAFVSHTDAEVARLNEVQAAMTGLSLASGGDVVHAIAELLATRLDGSVLIWDVVGGKVRAFAGDLDTRTRIVELLGARDPARVRALRPGSAFGSAIVHPIGRDRVLGLMLIEAPDVTTPFAEGIVRHAVGLLAYDLELERADHTARNVSRPSILHALVSGRLAARQANDVGTFVDATGQPLRIGFLHVGNASTATAISHRLNFSSPARGCLAAAAERDGVILMIEDANPLKLRATLETLLGAVAPESWSFGVSEPFVELDGARAALAQARVALGAAEINQITFHDDIAPTAALLKYLPNGAASAFVDQLLHPLIEYDARRNGALVETLGAYLRHRGSLRKAAEELYVHSNTVQLRLARISQLTGIDLHDLRQLGVLSLAYAWRSQGRVAGG